jgi:hypothetical protein
MDKETLKKKDSTKRLFILEGVKNYAASKRCYAERYHYGSRTY